MRASGHAMDRHSEPGKSGRPRLSREAALVRVLVWIEHRECAPFVLGEIYAAAGVSPRTLRTMFVDVFGMTPSRYLRVRRLHQVRTVLLLTDPLLRTVGDVCSSLRITDAGRFAREYHALFGEFPKQTLARRVDPLERFRSGLHGGKAARTPA